MKIPKNPAFLRDIKAKIQTTIAKVGRKTKHFLPIFHLY